MKIRLLLSIAMAALLCLFFGANAQCPSSTPLNISTTFYTQENGLLTNVLTRIAKDSTGYRYFFGVDKQWVRDDGVEFSRSNRQNEEPFIRTESWLNLPAILQFEGSVGYKFMVGKGRGLGWAVAKDFLFLIDTLRKTKQSYRLPATIIKQQLNITPDDEVYWLTTARDVYLPPTPISAISAKSCM